MDVRVEGGLSPGAFPYPEESGTSGRINLAMQRTSKGMKQLLVVSAGACLLLLSAAASGSSSPTGGNRSGGIHKVTAEQGALPVLWVWAPADIEIRKGEKVKWINDTGAEHAIRPWDGPWDVYEQLDAGTSVSMRFDKPGIYKYRCDVDLHSDVIYHGEEEDRTCVGMCGTITVK